MAAWPFGRRKRRRSRVNSEGPMAVEAKTPASPHRSNTHEPSRRSSRRSRRRSNRRDSTTRSRVSVKEKDIAPAPAPARTHSSAERLSPSQHSDDADDNITALPATKPLDASPHLRPATREYADVPYKLTLDTQMHTQSHTSLAAARERGKLQKRRSDDGTPRRKSTKRSRKDPAREEEIRQMSAPISAKRSADSMMRRDNSKKLRSGLNRHFDRPTSDVSLPTDQSMHSSMSGSGSDYASFKVSSLDIFAPRPTIRYSGSAPYYHTPVDRTQTDSRADSTRRISPISKETLKESKTIDDLADDMDSGTLRELMERDARRKERKQQAEHERLQRKLERRAEKQRQKEKRREDEAAARASRELNAALGLGIEQGGPVQAPETTAERGTTNTGTYLDYPAQGQIPANPFPERHVETGSPLLEPIHVEPSYSPVETPTEEPVIETAHAIRYSRSMSPPRSPVHHHSRGPSNVSQLPELAQEIDHTTSENPSAIDRSSSFNRRRSSDVSSSKRGGWWSAFKRRPSALKRRSVEQVASASAPSDISFSNTSRESMSRQALPPHLVQQTGRKTSGTPVRTQSKFREDLPERREGMLMSPPDSRVQSPEIPGAIPIPGRRGQDLHVDPESSTAGASIDEPIGRLRTDSPVSPGGRASALMSTSLASVDSEGSWLSGRPMKRSSNPAYYRSSFGSGTMRRPREEFNASYEELGIPDDEYFRRLTSGHENQSHPASRKPSSIALAANTEAGAEEDLDSMPESEQPEETLIHNNISRRPTVVHRQERAKSQEGLLSFFAEGDTAEAESTTAGAGDEMEGVERPMTPPERDLPSEESSPEIRRASSVKLSKGIKRFSANSAKLLDIRRSGSLDAKRTSQISHAESAAE